MEYKFDAFISYRHAEVDSAVAKDIQHWLEHFHVPKAIQKTSGKKKINRVFRDKEELPLSMNLGETITDALIHSEYLIVICSPRTKESQWVQREIEAFLETHDLEHILVVIAEGEPDDVIPKILTYKETTSVNENGEEITVKEDLEPLGCDYRVGKRKAHKEELPRLAASLLHCSYDDLIQRARQYRMRVISGILATVLALALGILGYVLYSNQKIKTNYENALRNQSEYLATESIKSFSNGDRFTAIALALEALPQKGTDRPYVAKAESALANAITAYNPVRKSETTLMPVGTFNTNGGVKELCANKGPYVAFLDDTDVISIFSVKKRRIVYSTKTPPEYSLPHLVGMTSKNSIIICSDIQSSIICYSLPDCKTLWEIKPTSRISTIDTVKLINDDLYFVTIDDSIHKINTGSGKESKVYPLSHSLENIPGIKKEAAIIITDLGTVFGDYLPLLIQGEMILGKMEESESFFDRAFIPAVLNLQTGEVQFYPQDNSLKPKKAIVTNRGDLIILSTDNDFNHTMTDPFAPYEQDKPFEAPFYNYKTRQTLCCIEMNTHEKKWEIEDTSEDYELFWDLSNIIFEGKSRTINAIMAVFSNKIIIIDPESGIPLKSVETDGSVITSESSKDIGAHFITREGHLYYLPFNMNSKVVGKTTPFYPYRLTSGWINKGVWIPNGQSVLRYAYGFQEDSWKPIPFEKPDNVNRRSTADSLIEDDVIAMLYDSGLLYSNGSPKKKMKYIDLKKHLEDGDYCSAILGQLSNKHIIVKCSSNGSSGRQLIEIDPKTESAQFVAIPAMGVLLENQHQLAGDTLYSLDCKYNKNDFNTNLLTLYTYNFVDQKFSRLDLGQSLSRLMTNMSISISPDQTMALVSDYKDGKGFIKIINLSDGKYVDVSRDNLITSSDRTISWYTSDKSPTLFAIGDQQSVSIWDQAGKDITQISDFEKPVYDVSFMDDGSLLVVTNTGYSGGELIHYSNNYSNVLGRTDISLDKSSDTTKWHFIDNIVLYLSGNAMDIINLEQYQPLSVVSFCEGYQVSSDSFICTELGDDHEQTIGYRKRYTTDTLISAAKKQLGDFKLSDTQCAEYGLQ